MERVTLKAIAEAADVSVMTASLALRDQGRISEETRRKIKACAARLGYRPDPALAALNAYRQSRRSRQGYTSLMLLTHFRTAAGWKDQAFARMYFEGATEQAERLGYKLEPLWLGQARLTPPRVTQILYARGIRGVVIAPIPWASRELRLDWDNLCSVSLSRSLLYPPINTVDHNHAHSMSVVWRELRARGYKRVGYTVTENTENMTGRLWLSAFLMEQQRAESNEAAIGPLITSDWKKSNFEAWYRQHQPDVVISPHIEPYRWLQEMRVFQSGQTHFVSLEADPQKELSGVCQNFKEVGRVALQILDQDLSHGAYGVPAVRRSVTIDGTWIEGRTLRPRTT